MPTDALLVLQASVTKTATFNSTGLDLVKGTPPRGLVARVIYSAASTTAGAGAATFQVQESSDNSTFTVVAQGSDPVLVLSTTAAAGEVFIPFVSNKRYCRLALSAISGTNATVTYAGDIVASKP